ncbi:MAG: UDP-glucose 4-epimerase [Actinomycetota bacterium]|nr:UDP-glucose 4-epimerase [Actinomycetota bacterium]
MWLVTGGAGYIGAHVVRALLADGQRVVVADDLSDGLVARVPDGVQLNIVSVLETEALAQVMTDLGVEGVVHLAAKKAAGDSVDQPIYYHQQNTGGVLSLLTAMEMAGVAKLVYSSSAAVYGEPVDDRPLTEDSRTSPTNPYGSSKLIGEMMIRDCAPALGLSWAALRYFNVAGCGADELSDTSANNLIPMLLRAHVAGRPGQIFGTDYPTPDGTCIRDYIHVVDLAEAHVAACRLVSGDLSAAPDPALRPPSAPGQAAGQAPGQAPADSARVGAILNIGTGRGSSVREVIDSVSRALGAPLAVEESPRRPGDPSMVQADPTRAAEVLGWRSHYDLDDMTSSAVSGLTWLSATGRI